MDSSQQGAVYSDGSIIRGTASLTLDPLKVSVREIAVKVRGHASSSSAPGDRAPDAPVIPDFTFLDTSTVLWSSRMSQASAGRKLEGPGPHTWSFAIPLPRTIRVGSTEYPLPPTYDNKARIQYSVEVMLKRGSIFQSDVTSVLSKPRVSLRRRLRRCTHGGAFPSLVAAFRYLPTSLGAGLSDSETEPTNTSGGMSSVCRFSPRLSDRGILASNINSQGIWEESGFSSGGMQVKVRRLIILRFPFHLLSYIRSNNQLATPSPREYSQGSAVPFYLAVNVRAGNPLAALLIDPSNWTVELIRCTLLGGAAARGDLDHYEADGSSVFVTSVARGRMEQGRNVGNSDWRIRGDLYVPRNAVLPFRFSMVAVYVRLPQLLSCLGCSLLTKVYVL